MKKLSLLSLCFAFCLVSLYGQVEKNDQLIVINGKISIVELSSLDVNNIESLSVSKSRAMTDEYGTLAKNGVISIVTKDNVNTGKQKDKSVEPLVLLDGKVYTGSLDSVNVMDIESITVKKDKSAVTDYGKAGENGVILIVTKDKASI